MEFTDVIFDYSGTSTISGDFIINGTGLLPLNTTVISSDLDKIFYFKDFKFSLFANKTEAYEVISSGYKEFFLPNLDREVIYNNGNRDIYYANGTVHYSSLVRTRII